MGAVAKIFMIGASQAVQLPREVHFDADEIGIKRVGKVVILFPKDAAWDLMQEVLGKMDDDFMAERDQPKRIEKRKPLIVKAKRP